MQTTQQKINPEHLYSAREALQFIPGFKKESDFRSFLKEDISGKNVFNAKVYTARRQQRFIIRGADLLNASKVYKRVSI